MVGLSFAPNVLAAGTLAGTVISNQAYADFKDANGNAMTRVLSNTVTTVVTQVAGVDIVPPTNSSTAAIGATVDYLIQLFNTGNANDEQTFSYAASGAFTPTVTMYYDANNNHIYDAGTDVLLTETAVGSKTYKTVTTGGTAVPINPDDDYDVIIRVTIPGTAVNNQQNIVTITTKSDYDTSKTATGTYTTTVSAAALSAVKTASSAAGSHTTLPGDTVTYTITLSNTGTDGGTGLVISDPIPTNMTYKTGSITVGGAAKTDASGDDGADYNHTTAGAVTVSAATIAAGETITVTFQATVNANVASGTPLENQASITYTSGIPLSVQTNATTFFVGNAASVSISTTATPATANPGDTVTFPFTVTNNGNLSDIFEVTHSSTAGWTWTVWYDSNNDGIAGNDGDFIITDTDADGKPDTGSINPGSGIKLLIVATVPAGTSDATTDGLSVTVYSAEDHSKTATVSFSTTVTAPVLSVVKAVSPTGSQPPGTVLTYTVTATNSGSGNANSVVITDIVPTYTTYKAGTIRTGTTTIGGTAALSGKTDESDGDSAQYDSGTKAVVVGSGGNVSLGANGVLVLEFQATID